MYVKKKIRDIITASFSNTIKRGDVSALAEFKNSTNGLENLLIALGVDEEILNLPAHRECLEEALKETIDLIIDGMAKGKFTVNLEHGEFSVKVDSFPTQDEFSIKLDDSTYSIDMQSKKTAGRLSYSKSRKTTGNIEEKEIVYIAEEEYYSREVKKGRKKKLDDDGFTIEDQIAVTSTEHNREKNEKLTLERKGKKVIAHSSFSKEDIEIDWSGNPLDLNYREINSLQVIEMARRFVRKYPDKQRYYEEVFGVSFEEKSRKLED